ncbi:MAG: hypothetical protein L0338_16165 [Acidobacteria bacterium]|nr:hypothetical protein [Acidobacteriota bacterium]
MIYKKPQITMLTSAINAVQSSSLKFIPIVLDYHNPWVTFATSSAYEADE